MMQPWSELAATPSSHVVLANRVSNRRFTEAIVLATTTPALRIDKQSNE
jgi:hypothetical protein